MQTKPRMPRRELPDPYKVEIVLDSRFRLLGTTS